MFHLDFVHFHRESSGASLVCGLREKMVLSFLFAEVAIISNILAESFYCRINCVHTFNVDHIQEQKVKRRLHTRPAPGRSIKVIHTGCQKNDGNCSFNHHLISFFTFRKIQCSLVNSKKPIKSVKFKSKCCKNKQCQE